jgi:hypothetical protein
MDRSSRPSELLEHGGQGVPGLAGLHVCGDKAAGSVRMAALSVSTLCPSTGQRVQPARHARPVAPRGQPPRSAEACWVRACQLAATWPACGCSKCVALSASPASANVETGSPRSAGAAWSPTAPQSAGWMSLAMRPRTTCRSASCSAPAPRPPPCSTTAGSQQNQHRTQSASETWRRLSGRLAGAAGSIHLSVHVGVRLKLMTVIQAGFKCRAFQMCRCDKASGPPGLILPNPLFHQGVVQHVQFAHLVAAALPVHSAACGVRHRGQPGHHRSRGARRPRKTGAKPWFSISQTPMPSSGQPAAKELWQKKSSTPPTATQMGAVLFKPTLTVAPQTFRTTRAGALWPTLWGATANFPQRHRLCPQGLDASARSKNAAVFIAGDSASTMGNVTITGQGGQGHHRGQDLEVRQGRCGASCASCCTTRRCHTACDWA